MKSRTIAALTLIAALALAGCSAKATVDRDAPAAPDKPAAVQPEETKAAEPVAPPAPKAGTLENPFPAGSLLVSTDPGGNELYNLTAVMTNGDAQAAIIEANQFNDLAPAGMKYVIVDVTYTGISADKPISPSFESYDLKLADAEGVLYNQASVVLPGTQMYEGGDLYAGQTFTGSIAFIVPADSRPLYLTSTGVYLAL